MQHSDVTIYAPEKKVRSVCVGRCALAKWEYVRIGLKHGEDVPTLGTIKMCGDCGRFWSVRRSVGFLDPDLHMWKPVRWYHLNERMRIRNVSV